jgi:hypothetical protein
MNDYEIITYLWDSNFISNNNTLLWFLRGDYPVVKRERSGWLYPYSLKKGGSKKLQSEFPNI